MNTEKRYSPEVRVWAAQASSVGLAERYMKGYDSSVYEAAVSCRGV